MFHLFFSGRILKSILISLLAGKNLTSLLTVSQLPLEVLYFTATQVNFVEITEITGNWLADVVKTAVIWQ